MPVAIFIFRSHPFYLLMVMLIWLFIISPLFIAGHKTLHLVFRKRAKKVLLLICEIQKQEQGDARVISYLRKINPFVFEELILLAFEQHGFPTIPNKRYTGDGGIDGRVNVYGQIWPIQAKRYCKHIKKAHIEQFDKLIQNKNYPGGVFIHTGRTGKEVRDRYRNTTLIIISGSMIVDFLCFPNNHTFAYLLAFRNVKVSNMHIKSKAKA